MIFIRIKALTFFLLLIATGCSPSYVSRYYFVPIDTDSTFMGRYQYVAERDSIKYYLDPSANGIGFYLMNHSSLKKYIDLDTSYVSLSDKVVYLSQKSKTDSIMPFETYENSFANIFISKGDLVTLDTLSKSNMDKEMKLGLYIQDEKEKKYQVFGFRIRDYQILRTN